MVTYHEGRNWIVVNFTRIVDGGDDITHTLTNVKSVTWSHGYEQDNLVSQDTSAGFLQTTYTVTGLIEVYGDPALNVEAQQTLETALRTVGAGTLHYTGTDDQLAVRFTGLSFDEYDGHPVGTYSATFITETANPQSHSVVQVGALTLSIANGFDAPSVTDSLKAQGPDEQLVTALNRSFTISGNLVGDTETVVNTAQALLVSEVVGTNTLVLDLSSATGGAAYTVRPGEVSFGAPKSRGSKTARSYSFTCKTHDDYTKEPYTLGETALTFGGSIELDVVDNTDYSAETELVSSAYVLTDEKFVASGKKYFVSEATYKTFRDSFRPLPFGTYVQSQNTHNSLALVQASVGKFERDGNYPVSGDKRYAAAVSLSFAWKKDENQLNQVLQDSRLGIQWYKVGTVSFSMANDAFGTITGRSVSLTGKVKEGDLTTAKGLIGTPQTLNDGSFGNSGLPGHTDSYYVTSISINKVDVVRPVGGGVEKVFDITVSAQQLDSTAQKAYFLRGLFQVDSDTKSIFFDKVTNVNKSMANRWDTNLKKYLITSMNMTVSGEIWEPDNGSGKPTNTFRGLRFLRSFDSTYQGRLNASSEGVPNRQAAAYSGASAATSTLADPPAGTSPLLPDYNSGGAEDSYQFTVTNISVGDWQPFTKQSDPGKGTTYWAQSITVTGSAIFDLTDSGTQPKLVRTLSSNQKDEVLKHTELQVAGFGIKFKAIGVDPATMESTITIDYEDRLQLETASPSLGDETPSIPGTWPWLNDNIPTKTTFSISGTSAKWTKGWKASKAFDEL